MLEPGCGVRQRERDWLASSLEGWVEGLIRLMNGEHTGPINLGNPGEFTIRQLAELVRQRINPALPLIEQPLPAGSDSALRGHARCSHAAAAATDDDQIKIIGVHRVVLSKKNFAASNAAWLCQREIVLWRIILVVQN